MEVDAETAGHADHLRRYGFTVVHDVMPADLVDELREEVVAAQAQIGEDWRQVGGQGENDIAWDEVWPGWEEQPAGPLAQNLVNWPGSKSGFPQSQLVRLPRFREYLAHPRVMAIARAVLHEHVRLLHLAVPKTLAAAGADRLHHQQLIESANRRGCGHSTGLPPAVVGPSDATVAANRSLRLATRPRVARQRLVLPRRPLRRLRLRHGGGAAPVPPLRRGGAAVSRRDDVPLHDLAALALRPRQRWDVSPDTCAVLPPLHSPPLACC